VDVLGSPRRFARVMWRISTNLSAQVKVLGLLRIGVLSGYVYANPRFLFKALSPEYLLRGLPASTRSACFLYHYQKLHAVCTDNLFTRLMDEDLPVFQKQDGECLVEVTLGRSRHIKGSRFVDHEGELSLNLVVDRIRVYVFSFTIVPGWVVGSEAAEALMLTRLQGELSVFSKTQLASKATRGMPPEMILISALRGVAEALGIHVVAGVRADLNLCYDQEDDAVFRKAYDFFFLRVGAVGNSSGFFLVSFPLPKKPLSEVKRGQKTRTRARRALEMEMATEAYEYLRQHGIAAAERIAEWSDILAPEVPEPDEELAGA
jgi:uncharacterized protein VirK/YbjX